MSRVVHFEIPTDDVEKAKKFYGDVFSWSFDSWAVGDYTYWMIMTGDQSTPGIDGGFYVPEGPMKGIINTIDVANLDQMLEKVVSSGGSVAVPKMAIPGVGHLAYAADPDGNLFGMMQSDRSVEM